MWAVGAILYVVLAGCHPFDPAGNATAEEMVGSTLTLTLTLALTLILTLTPTVTLTLTLTLALTLTLTRATRSALASRASKARSGPRPLTARWSW